MLHCTRRELIAAFLGAPLAAACRPSAARDYVATLGGQDHVAGHRVRDGVSFTPTRTRRVPVVIVGAGVAGLSAAWRLSGAGYDDYEVLELEREPGGTSRSGSNDFTKFPWGAHYVPCPLPHARAVRALLLEMGVANLLPNGELEYDEAQLVRAPQERLFVADRWYEGLYPAAGASREDLSQLARFEREVAQFSALRDASGRRAFAVPLAHAGESEETAALDGSSFAAWLRARDLTSPRLRWWLEYGTRDDLGATLEQTSAFAGLHYHTARTTERGPSAFLTWPEGNGRLVAHLARTAGRRLRCGALVSKVRARTDGSYELQCFTPRVFARDAPAVLASRHEPAGQGAELLIAEHVVLAVPQAVAARVLDPLPDAVRAGAATLRSGAWLVVNLTLRKRPVSHGYPECWDNVLYGSPSLGYVVATHQSDSAQRGRTLWTWYLPLLGDDPAQDRKHLLALTAEDCAELALADLARAHPDIAHCVERCDAFRWGHAIVRPTPGLYTGPLAHVRQELSRAHGRLHFAHTELSGMALFEEAQWHGVRAAEEVLNALGRPPQSLL
ncbi:MAG TPA: FAD-dependent oxidoreductase [Polyangiales bacterium]|nr:FAD-dependent oxidoreductase [Polyangiales bacterium]